MSSPQPATRPRSAPTRDGTGACAQRGAFEILARCHEQILEKLASLEEVSRGLRREGVFSDARLAALCDILVFLDTAVPMHSADEEQSLFPRLRRCRPFVGNEGDTPMDCMESEHKQHQRLLAALKRAVMQRAVQATANAAIAVVNVYRAHIGTEDELLLPWAQELLTDASEVAAMTREMRARREAASLAGC